MRTFTNPKELNHPVGEFTYEGCRYSGIEPGLSFSILSDGLASYLLESFPFLVESEKPALVVENKFCCSKCGRDCKSGYMRDRHEKVCTEVSKGMAPILKPVYIFWNYKNLDKSQLTEDQLLPGMTATTPTETIITEKEVTEPMPGREGMALIGKRMQPVVTDRDGIDWYGDGLQDDPIH